ncbi:uncharacterized protein LOC8288332 isoform X2 [Ricinus communis]|uniref:uncharacterized protein LOC8288332 isoform X2 n=1 Tax=Ricinus communis TaxID=3988 RepID=UPI0007724BCC|nr:uncharacterized protein LOC8288332 isoform X2 [Ricinus communis]|eukprot:XP_015578104.1 uncharacterized protein LOC8288332 [Ricinus communis]
MKVAQNIVFLFKDSDGFASAVANALCPSPNTSFHRLEETFELSLGKYGIKDLKAIGNLIHFVDSGGNYQVSVLLLEKYEPPTLVCAVSEVLTQMVESSLSIPALIVPFVGMASKLKHETSATSNDGRASFYGVQIGPETDITSAIVRRTKKPPSSLQIHFEPLACFLQVVRILKLPTTLLFGRLSDKAAGKELEILSEMGELLASTMSLSFSREKITWNPAANTSKDIKEPWRALYG